MPLRLRLYLRVMGKENSTPGFTGEMKVEEQPLRLATARSDAILCDDVRRMQLIDLKSKEAEVELGTAHRESNAKAYPSVPLISHSNCKRHHLQHVMGGTVMMI